MGKQAEGAFLFWARDWLTDENVVLMSPAAKGVYVDLLCHCWLEGSIPACSEHLQRIARIDAHAFAAVWRELEPRFAPHPTQDGRLVNRRMDEERAKADERRKSRSEKASRAAQARWQGAPSTARRSAQRNARSTADASPQAMLRDAHQSNPSTTPLPPETGGGASEPQQNQKRAPRAQSAEPDTEPRRARHDDGSSPIADLTTRLMRTRFRAGIANALVRRASIRDVAEKLVAQGMTTSELDGLAVLADVKSSGDPGALLSHWLDDGLWRDVLAEQAMKGREAVGAAARAKADDDVLQGIYGADPKPAASVVDEVLANARTA